LNAKLDFTVSHVTNYFPWIVSLSALSPGQLRGYCTLLPLTLAVSNVTEVKRSPSYSANDNINYVVVFIFKTLFFYVHDDSILFECILTGVQEIAGKDTVLLVLALKTVGGMKRWLHLF